MLKGRFIAAVVGLFCLLAIPSSASAMKFATPAGSPISGLGYVSRVVSADFNNDGRDDLATATGTISDGVSIRLAQSDGTWATAASLGTGNGVYSLAAGDITRDGKMDLVTFWTQGAGIRLWVGNGDGTFSGPVVVPASTMPNIGGPRAMQVGDVTDDGKLDVLYGLDEGKYAISVGTGTTGFDNSLDSGTSVPGAPAGPGYRFNSVSIGDYDGDSHTDLALGMSPATLDDPSLVDVYVLLGDGAGNFLPAAGSPIQVAEPAGFEGRIFSMATGNFNGDDRDDLAISTIDGDDPRGLNSGSKGTIQTFLGSATNGLSATGDVFTSNNRPGPVLARDFDNDNLTDLAWLERIDPNGPNVDQVVIARGSGNGTFTTSPGTTFEMSTSTVSSTDLVSGDFNLDGAFDFAGGFANSGIVRILRNQIDPVKNRDSIDFGDVVINSGEKQQGVVIGNAGGPTATVGQATITGVDASAFTLPASGCAGQPIAAAFGSCLQGVKFNPISVRSYSANLHVTFSGSTEVLDIPLAANVVAPGATISPDPLSFGQTFVNSTKTRTLQITSSGDAPLFISSLIDITGTNAGRYQITSDGCANHTLAPGDSCFIDVKLNATSEIGNVGNAQLNVTNDGYLSPQSVALTYTGINPGITVNPSSRNFGPVTVGSSEFQTFTVDASGSTDLEIDDILVTDDGFSDFSIVSNDCPATLEAGDDCQFEVEFAPNAANTANRSAQVQIGTNAQVPTKVVPLSGTARQAKGALDTGDFDFGDVSVGSSASRTITVTSNGDVPLFIQETWVNGPNTDDNPRFVIDNDTCSGNTIPVGQTCSYRVTFTPDARRDFLAFTGAYNNTSFDETVQMTGNGVQPAGAFDVPGYDFGSATIGGKGDRPSRTFSLNSTGLDPLSVQSLTIEGPDASSFKLANPAVCSAAIPANESCQVTVSFDPASGNPGGRSAVLSAQTNGGIVEVDLTGQATAATPPNYRFTVKCPKKVKAGGKLSCNLQFTNPLPTALKGAKITYKATQGKSGKAIRKGTIKVPTLAAGKPFRRKLSVWISGSPRLKRGKPVTMTFSLSAGGKTVRTEKIKFKQEFGPTQASKKD